MTLVGFALCAQAACAQNVYRCVQADGRIVYADSAVSGNCSLQQVQTPTGPGAAPPTGLSDAEKKLLEQADRRAAELDQAAADIVSAFNALRAAEARREQGAEPLEGERSGRRFRPEYWARQQALQRGVDEARARLDGALARRNALR